MAFGLRAIITWWPETSSANCCGHFKHACQASDLTRQCPGRPETLGLARRHQVSTCSAWKQCSKPPHILLKVQQVCCIPEHVSDWDSLLLCRLPRFDVSSDSAARRTSLRFIVSFRLSTKERVRVHPLLQRCAGKCCARPSFHTWQAEPLLQRVGKDDMFSSNLWDLDNRTELHTTCEQYILCCRGNSGYGTGTETSCSHNMERPRRCATMRTW